MSVPILATKFHIPAPRPKTVPRRRLLALLDRGMESRLTLLAAPAGFGKTTLLGEWIAGCGRPVVWLSLDEGDNDPARFLAHLVAALRPLAAGREKGLLDFLHTPMPPSMEAVLTALVNGIDNRPEPAVFVLDDYHAIHSEEVDLALGFFIEHAPSRLKVILATRRVPRFPLGRLRAGGGLTEITSADLRFTRDEAGGFLNEVMGLSLSSQDIASLDARTEGWIAGLQLAALSMQGHEDAAAFIRDFTGSHHYITDYLIEEVLHRQPERIQAFLLRTSILDRLCGPLCDVLMEGDSDGLSAPGGDILRYLEEANLFIVPLDHERRWYRYHHLFSELLRERLRRNPMAAGDTLPALHRRASLWYKDKGLEVEAFHHAVAAGDVGLASRLVLGEGMPLPFRGAVMPVLAWLKAQPREVLDMNPTLWVTYAAALLFAGQTVGIEPKLEAAEAALRALAPDATSRDLMGRIAATRATLALMRRDALPILEESRKALEWLHPDNLYYRTSTAWKLGYAHQLQGDRSAAARAYTEAKTEAQATGNLTIILLASMGLGTLQESDNRLRQAAETYRDILAQAGDPALPGAASEAHLGLARIAYEWNDLEGAERHYRNSVPLARQLVNTDRFAAGEVFRARLRLAQGDTDGAWTLLAEMEQLVRRQGFHLQVPEVAAAQVLVLLRKGKPNEAAALAERRGIPGSLARVRLAQGDAEAALALLQPLLRQMEEKGWEDARLRLLVLQALALQAHGAQDAALRTLGKALATAAPEGFIRLFVDEGAGLTKLLSFTAAQGTLPDYIATLLRALEAETWKGASGPRPPFGAGPGPGPAPVPEPLSPRELEVLALIAKGLSNEEISRTLFLALSTVKGHNLKIFGKLRVQRRTEAIVRGRELGLL